MSACLRRPGPDHLRQSGPDKVPIKLYMLRIHTVPTDLTLVLADQEPSESSRRDPLSPRRYGQCNTVSYNV